MSYVVSSTFCIPEVEISTGCSIHPEVCMVKDRESLGMD